MIALRSIALTVRFACELAMLAALAWWGYEATSGASRWLLAAGAPLVAATTWGLFVAPKAARPVPMPTRLAIEAVLFGAAVAALTAVGQPRWALVLAIAATSTSAVNAATERSPTRLPARDALPPSHRKLP